MGNELLFKLVYDTVVASGGDGGGWIISKHNYLKLAEDFGGSYYAWHFSNSSYNDDKDLVVFSHGEECICFAKDRSHLPNAWQEDIVVEIY
jgi:hypothetical protein